MIFALFILCCFFTFSVLCGLAILGYRSRAHSAEARANRAEGALEISQHNLNVMAGITRECVKDIGLDPQEIVPNEVAPPSVTGGTVVSDNAERYVTTYTESNYTPKTVAFCPSCNVSVRHDPNAYPVPCPACQTLIDPVLDDPPIFDISN